MKTPCLICLFLFGLLNATAQFREPVHANQNYFVPGRAVNSSPKQTFIPGLLADQSHYYKVRALIPTDQYLLNVRPTGHFAWIGSVTSQSFNNGKFGTFYYWDMQGNLQGTRGFIDLAGKNKRGFKLLFPWR